MNRVTRCALYLCLALLLHGDLLRAASALWSPSGNLAEARSGSAAVLLPDGRILFTGGQNTTGPLASTEFFSTSGSFTPGAAMQQARTGHAAVVLPDGRVLVTGGATLGGTITNSAELYDPSANTWTMVAGGMTIPRTGQTATVLKDGRVLITGGRSTNGPTNTLEIFSPATNGFAAINATHLSAPRQQHASALLRDGRVLIAGGSDGTASLSSVDIYDPASNAVSSAGTMSTARASLSATTLLDGTVLLAGGNNGTIDLASAESYNPTSATFTPTGSLAAARSGPLSILLPNNNEVLIVGGTSAGTALQTAELFVPWAGQFTTAGSMLSPRSAPAASLLQSDGQLLVAGGTNGTTTLTSGEIYNFATIKTDQSDYPPGTIVNITGSGWQPGETVTLTLVESPLYDTHGPYTAVADSNGNIFNNQFVTDEHDANIRFYLTAKGSASQAQMTFTDSTQLKSLTVGGQSGSLIAGSAGSVTYPVTVNFNGSGTCTVTLSVTGGLPAGVQYSFSPASLTGVATTGGGATPPLSSTLTITTTNLTPAGSTAFTVMAQGTGGAKNDCTTTESIFSQTPAPTLVVGTAAVTPVITWSNPADITYGTPLSGTQLNATASVGGTAVAGSFAYNPATGTILSAGNNQNLSVTFTPTDTTKYTTATKTVQINVTQATPTITWAAPAAITYGTALSTAQLNATASVQGTFSYSPAAGTILKAGIQGLSVTFTPADTTDYTTATKTVSITVSQATSTVTWPNPADISYGTALSGTQLNATATVPGTFVYNPSAGTVLNTGNGQTLFVTFTPNDTTDYTPAIGSAQINVLPTTPGITNSGPGTSTYGASVTLSVTLNAPAGAETPTGTVQFQFTNNGTTYNICSNGSLQTQPTDPPCSITLSNGAAMVTTSNLPAGTTPDSITAKYTPADSNYQGISTTISYTVNTASTHTALQITPASGATYGDTITLSSTVTNTATAQGSTATPTGSVQFQYSTDGGTTWVNIGLPVTLDTSANAQTTTTVLPAGQPALRAQYVPDNNFAASNSGPMAYNLKPKALTVSGITASNKAYDGKMTATLDTSNAQLAGIIGSDDVHLVTTGATGTFADANAGTGKTVTVNGLSLAGTAKSNYTLSQVTATANITPVQVTVTAPSQTVTYGDPVPAPLTPTYNAFVNSEDSSVLTTQPTCTTTYTPNSSAGSNPTTSCSGADAVNYTFTYVPGIITVNKANATVTVTGYSVTYNGTSHTATGTVTGVKGEPLSGLDLSGTTHTNAGTYTDTWTFTDSTGNYNSSNGTVTDTIAQATPTVTVTGGTFTYDTTPHPATTQITGVSGDNSLTSSMVTISYTPGDSAAPVNAGSYAVVGSFPGNQNYKAVSGTATITINKADATITLNGGTYTYDANPHPASVMITGVKGDAFLAASMVTINYTPGGANAPVSAGSYSAVGSFPGTGNYNPATSSAATVTINKANATVTVTPYSVTYDGSAHTATGKVTGVKGEALSGLDLSGTTHTNAGTYATDAWTFTDTTGNYNNASSTVSDSIAQASAIINVQGYSGPYDGTAHGATGSAVGVMGENLSSLLTAPGGFVDVPGGTVNWTFAGNNNYKPASGAVAITLTAASTATTLTSVLTQSNGAVTVTLTAAVSSPAPLTGGTVTFTDGSNNNAVLGNPGLNAGKATLTIPAGSLSAGPHLITATYVPPSLDFAGSASTPNAAPGVTITNPSSGSVNPITSPVNFSATLTGIASNSNPGADWTFTNTGTNVSTSGTGTVSATGTTITGSNTFASAGVYGVVLTFTDGAGDVVIANTVSASSAPADLPATVVIYDPSAGFVTGGGWIMSPTGAYAANPSLTGKATFGFVSKYQKGQSVPTGDTQFTFQAGKLDFHSTIYQWMVISGGMAQYQGSGTITGLAGTYNFLLTARDGSLYGNNNPDGFRIKITDASGNLVYDNMPAASSDAMTSGNTQVLGGGSVIIHSN